jgi:hypothetical protein
MATAALEGQAQREAIVLAQQEEAALAEAAEREALGLDEEDDDDSELTLDEQIQRDMEFIIEESDFTASAPAQAEPEAEAPPTE